MPNSLKHALAKEALTMWQDYEGGDAVTLEIIFVLNPGQGRSLWLEQLEDERQYGMLRYDSASGKANPQVRPGNYVLEYRGKAGGPGQAYKIAVVGGLAGGVKWEPDKRADKYGNVLGVKMLEVS